MHVELLSPRLAVTGLLWFSFHVAATTGAAQIPPTGARAVALGGATVGLDGVDGAEQNPAALSMLDRATASFGFSRLFGIPELDASSVDAAVPVGGAVLNVRLNGFGFDAFSETELSAALAARISGIGTGLRIRAIRSRFDTYGAANRLSLDAGWMYEHTPEVRLGFGIRNVGVGLGGIEMAAGLSMRHDRRLLVVISTAMSRGVPADVRFGFEMTPVDALVLRLGGAMNPGVVTAGVGMVVSRLIIDVAVALHARLGLTPVFTIRFVK